MKRNLNNLIGGLIVCGFATLILIVWLIWDIPFIPEKLKFPTFVFVWILQLAGAMNIGAYFVKPKPNYRWKDLKEKEVFTIISKAPSFTEENTISEGLLIVKITGFGETLMAFPKGKNYWKGASSFGPDVKSSYMKIGNDFIRIYE